MHERPRMKIGNVVRLLSDPTGVFYLLRNCDPLDARYHFYGIGLHPDWERTPEAFPGWLIQDSGSYEIIRHDISRLEKIIFDIPENLD